MFIRAFNCQNNCNLFGELADFSRLPYLFTNFRYETLLLFISNKVSGTIVKEKIGKKIWLICRS
jgi:hypothetical protein